MPAGGGPADGAEAAARETWARYLEALAPYIAALIVTPLLDPAGAPPSLRELHAQLREAGITPQWMAKHVYLSDMNLEAGRWWTLVLHQFAHSDINHLSNNILSIVLFGRGVHERLGSTEAFYALLVGGATATGYLHVLGKREEGQWFAEMQGLLPRLPFGDASKAGRWYAATVDRFAGFMTRQLAPVLPIPAIGASGGACCLMGASVVVGVEELVNVASELLRVRRRGGEEQQVVLKRSAVRLVLIGFNLLSLCSCFLQELRQVKPTRGDCVNHRSHVDGFLIGGAFYVAWRYGPRAWARLKGWGAGGGPRGSSSSRRRGGNIWG